MWVFFEIHVYRVALFFVLDCDLKIQAKVFSRAAAIGQADLTGGVSNDFFYGLMQLVLVRTNHLVKPLARIVEFWFARVVFLNHDESFTCF